MTEPKWTELECPKCNSREVKAIWGWGPVYMDYECQACGQLFTFDKEGIHIIKDDGSEELVKPNA